MNPLDKDKAAIVKDIGTLAAEVFSKSEELKKIKLEIESAKEERARQNKLTSQFISEIDSKILEKKKELEKLEQKISHTDNSTKDKILSLDSEIKFLGTEKVSLEAKIKNLNETIEFLTNAESQALSRTNLLKNQVPALEFLVRDANNRLEGLNFHIEEKTKELNILEKKTAGLEEEIQLVRNAESGVASYRHELEERERGLDLRENEITVMEERLTPEYKKEFGRFHNLINGKQK